MVVKKDSEVSSLKEWTTAPFNLESAQYLPSGINESCQSFQQPRVRATRLSEGG
jgi:hypothetical protein